jgi:hypothetical protein
MAFPHPPFILSEARPFSSCGLLPGPDFRYKSGHFPRHIHFANCEARMNFRSLLLTLTISAIAALAFFNWSTLATPTQVSLGLITVEAPLGLLMLGLTTLLAALFIAYVLWLQGSVLLETRRHGKEMQAQRELADKAEASRFTEMKAFLESRGQQTHAALMERIETLEARLLARANESDNTTAAYVGQMEHQLGTSKQLQE